jgi:hypothetical protein
VTQIVNDDDLVCLFDVVVSGGSSKCATDRYSLNPELGLHSADHASDRLSGMPYILLTSELTKVK